MPVNGSTLPGAPQRIPVRGRMLVTAFRSPGTTAAFADAIPGSKLLACHFASEPAGSSARSAFLLRYRNRFAPDSGRFPASGPLQIPRPARLAFPPTSTPLWGSYPPPDQSVRLDLPRVGPPSGPARSPFAPRSRYLSLERRLRIIVPGPLRFRRLAVPQTSWNLIHYRPGAVFGQMFFGVLRRFSSISFLFVFS